MMLMRSPSPLLAQPNTCDASQFVSQGFPCGWQQHWSTAALLGFTAVLVLPRLCSLLTLSLPAPWDPVAW